MKTVLTTLIFLAAISISTTAQRVEKLWETEKEFEVPESVLFADSVLFVSNVNGKPLDKNGKGYISKVSLQGMLIKKQWATGLNAPKGMGIYKGNLYVADIDRVVVINLKSEKIEKTFEFPNAIFLNDITINSMGKVYISDLRDKTIYAIQQGNTTKLVSNEKLENVNGLFHDGNFLLAGTSSGVYRINEVGEIEEHFIKNTGSIDGLEKLDAVNYIISDWKGKIHIINANAEAKLLLNHEKEKYNAADIGVDINHKIVYVPTFYGNTVVAYKIFNE